MRVPSISAYYTSTYRLGNLTDDLQNANEVVSTQRQINEVSDDPLGLSQTLSLGNSLGTLDQIEKNVIMGKTWLESGENALDSVNNLILEAKSEVIRLSNDSVTADERMDAIERIDSIIEQVVSLGNTQVNGNYIFGGTETSTIPFTYDQSTDPNRVIYSGNNDPFEVRTDRNSQVAVGRDGQNTFWDRDVEINSTNNTVVFTEDNGRGAASQKVLTAVVPDGSYSADDLETAVRNALNAASAESGYAAIYQVAYDSETQRFSVREDGTYDGYLKTEFKWDTGGESYINDIKASDTIDPDGIDIQVETQAVSISTPEPEGSAPFTLVWQGNDEWKIVNNPGYVITPETISGTRDSVTVDLNEDGNPDIRISLDTPADNVGDYVSFEMVAAQGDKSIGHEIGFNGTDEIQAPPVSDTPGTFITDLTLVDGANDQITFREVDSTSGSTTLSIDLNTTGADVTYTDMDALAKDIENKLEQASDAGPNQVGYNVSYDPETSRFDIREDGSSLDEFHLDWDSSNAASTLGFYPVADSTVYPSSDTALNRTITLTSDNNQITFQEMGALGTAGTAITAAVATGTYRNTSSLAAAVEAALDSASGNVPPADYSVTYNAGTNRFNIQDVSGNLSSFSLLFDSGVPQVDEGTLAKSLGYDPDLDYGGFDAYASSQPPVIMSFDSHNKYIEFAETDARGNRVQAAIEIPEGDYTDPAHIASAIETAMTEASFNNVGYKVTYDAVEQEFVFKEDGSADISSFEMLWYSGGYNQSDAAFELGFDGASDDKTRFAISDRQIVNITIDASNDKLDFIEVTKEEAGLKTSRLTASIPQASYTSHEGLAKAVEKSMEDQSLAKGNRIDYTVAWDEVTQKFTIKENGSELEEFQLQWHSGDNKPASLGGTGQSIGGILGFDANTDDVHTAMQGDRQVAWGIFDTLIDLKQYLSENDRDGIERTIGRLETSYDNMTSKIVDIGMKTNRLQIRQTITSEVSLSLANRKSNIEDADMIESIMNLQNIETAYQAALASTSRVLNISLVDYLT
jgi:flagellar hook-associated protein 3 FlgL